MRTVALWLVGALVAVAAAEVIYHTTPDWVSAHSPYSTGAALVDVDRDGWLDLVIANGNDMSPGPLEVYYNRGDGTFPTTPDWQSADLAYHGHLDAADINGDGWPDVAVSVLLNEGGPAAKVYMNHNGALSSLPEWTSAEIASSFGVAFGDMNGDGRPDLAVGTGNAYYSPQYRNTVHLNIDGQLEQTASWQSGDTLCYMGVLWTDVDQDGWLDLLGVGAGTYTQLYHNLGGTLELNPSWHTTDNGNQLGIMATTGDLTGDGRRDLIVTDNTQLGSNGYFRQYNGVAGGFFNTRPDWAIKPDIYGSAVALADIDADGDLDLALGAWWSTSAIFFNTGAGLVRTPSWRSNRSTVVEKIVFGDLRNRGLRRRVEESPVGSPAAHLFFLAHQPLQQILAVRRNGVELLPSQYTFSREQGWVSVGPSVGDVEIEYSYSVRLDMVVVNWDPNDGNLVYYNQLPLPGDMDCDGLVNNGDIDAFVLALTDSAAYAQQYPGCNIMNGDINGDGLVNNGDIDAFVALLTGG